MLDFCGTSLSLGDGDSRRTFLRASMLGGIGWLGTALLRAQEGRSAQASAAAFGRAQRCVLLFLTGGPPQLDTFDPKPEAPAEIRGEFKPIATSVPGVRFGELLPRLAGLADKFCIVRSITHADTVHTSAGYTMLTGAAHPLANTQTAANIRPLPDDHPHIGSILSRVRPPADGGPAFVALPEVIKDAAVNEFPGLTGGLLGRQYDPFLIEANSARTGFQLPDIALPPEMSALRLEGRRRLLDRLDLAFRRADQFSARRDIDAHYVRAYDVLRSPPVQNALRLEREPPRVQAAYGAHLFGQSCLLARRLLEASVPLVSVYWHYEGPDDSPVWDTHENNFKHLRERLVPPTDQAIAALLADLSSRGMLSDTLVICMGEFGRTPRINRKAGRDHWPHVQSILLAGAGIPAGSVFGASDRHGAFPAMHPVSPADLTATFLHLLGIAPNLEVQDRSGRLVRLCHGTPVARLIV